MKFFVITDVHGFYDEMMKALNDAGYDKDNPEHFLISCGDSCDRGLKSKEVLEFLLSIPEDRRALIRGNHEDMFDEAIGRRRLCSHDFHNGVDKTLLSLTGLEDTTKALYAMDNCELYQNYRKELVDYFETPHYVFVHGWIPTVYYSQDDWRDSHDADWSYDYYGARWLNGMEEWAFGRKDPKGKTIVCGHYHTSWGNSRYHHDGEEFGENANFKPFIDDGIIALDACTAYSGFCNCVVLED